MDAQDVLNALSIVMDEQSNESTLTENERAALAHYNNIRQYLDQDLVKCMERLSYEDKFKVLERANTLMDTIGLCLLFPELINKHIIGCYGFDQTQMRITCGKYVDKGIAFSSKIPTILTHGKEDADVHALNLAGKRVAISKMVYQKLESESVETVKISGIMYAYHRYSDIIPENAAIILFPIECDKCQPYYKWLFFMLDVLIVYGKNISKVLPELNWDLNLKELALIGFSKDAIITSLSQKVKRFGGKLVVEQSAVETLDMELHRQDFFGSDCSLSNNFCNQIVMENCLCSTFWYLSRQKEALKSQIVQVNTSLISDDKETQKQAKMLQEEIRRKMETIDECSKEYLGIMQKILTEINSLQKNYGIEEAVGQINLHVNMAERLLELLATEGMFFKHYFDKTANNHIRNLNMLYGRLCEDSRPAEFLTDQYFSENSNVAVLKAFVQYETNSPILLHVKLEMYNELGLSVQECKKIIAQLKGTLTGLEYRLLGIANLEQDNLDDARSGLMKAMRNGDQYAGEVLYCNELFDDISELADNGVAEAAYELGGQLYREYRLYHKPKVRRKMMKYLHIAAAKEHKEAVQFLGDIWYNEAMETDGESEERFKFALHYYQIAEKLSVTDNIQLYERMGLIYYRLENYRKSRTYLEKADTTEACFILGVMYDKAQGTSRDRDKALCYYKRAATLKEGHYRAMLAQNRIMAEIEEEKKKKIASENTSYKRTSTTTNYSSSSGW